MSSPRPAGPLLPVFLCLALLPAACGGGGGGGAPAALPRLELRDASFASGADTVELPVIFAAAGEVQPSLIQFELVTDGAALDFTGEVTPAQGVETVAAQRLGPGRLRVVLGDTASADAPRVLPDGALLTAALRRGPSAVAGTPVEVRLEAYRAADAAGAEAGLDGEPVTANVTP